MAAMLVACTHAFAFAPQHGIAVGTRYVPRIRLLAESPDPMLAMKNVMSNAFFRMTDFRVARASHILLKGFDDGTVSQMEAWKAEIGNDPARFAEVASANSLCPSRIKGGDLGFFTRGKMVKECAEPAVNTCT